MVAPSAAPLDPRDENARIDAALGAEPALAAACNTCGAPPGRPCITNTGDPMRMSHRQRVGEFETNGPATPGTGIEKVESASDIALRGLQEAVRRQLIAFCDEPISAKSLSRLQRFCSHMGQAMIGLEKPDQLVRDRFGKNGVYAPLSFPPLMSYGEDEVGDTGAALAPAPGVETYGANASRGLIAEATKIGKEMIQAQVDGQKAARRISTLPELVASLVLAKKQKLGKAVIKALEKQIADAGKDEDAPVPGGV